MYRDAFLHLKDAGFRSADRRSDAVLDGKSIESRALLWLAATEEEGYCPTACGNSRNVVLNTAL